eukprot:TRINITY_DN59988_c0_g1_i2.p1 TRINITY_DN59988_c0_g1~~TRINITY_DN59988_c0_g1_i2.p1  ORF type:complete len:233 (+),score=59.11 TRINITY_DN59988_c0_g1_i2:212-910(+)
MPSLLTIVAVKCRVLVDHFDGTYANCAPGHLDAVAKKVLAKLGSGGGEARASWTVDAHVVHTLHGKAGEFVYLTITSQDVSKAVAFKFLERLEQRFESMFPSGQQLPEQWRVAMEAKPMMEALMTNLNTTAKPSDPKAQVVKAAVDEAKDVMINNIEKVIDRGEKVDSLLGKSSDLAVSSSSFKSSARAASRAMWWQNMKQKVYLAGFALGGIVVLVLLVCGPTLASCRSRK